MEYKLKKSCNGEITIGNFDEINKLIQKKLPFSLQGALKFGKKTSATYQFGDDSVFMNYGLLGTTAWIPLNAQEVISQFESKTKLKLEKLN